MSTSRRESPEEAAKRVEMAQREHERADRGRIAMFPTVTGFAVEALKAPALVNGGAAAAMLAFVGTGRQPVTADTIFGLKLFAVGLVLAAIATAPTYFAQYFYLAQMQSTEHGWDHPFVVETGASRKAWRLAVAFHAFAVVLVLAAYACATFGLWSVASGLVPLAPRS
ncbi:hypothetical protein [Methylobacterium sp. Leaf85]|uniref:hypothetical protein n=1 Tax=Methylobacterium sp. Leaf85 TaxID=1736241 RepID=UPI0012E7022A|nr:hypothetical protein [Methylobacterium sp. Leaf85]